MVTISVICITLETNNTTISDTSRKKAVALEIGIEELLKGIRKTSRDDLEILEKGLALFEILYASKT